MGEGVGEECAAACPVAGAGVAAGDEFDGSLAHALMKQLVKRVLAERADRAPDHRGGRADEAAGIVGYAFAVGFHLKLLEEVRQFAEAVGVGEYGAVRDAERGVEEYVHHGEAGGRVLGERRVAEVGVHLGGAGEEFRPAFGAKSDLQRQADG